MEYYLLGGTKMYAIIETGGKQYRVEKGDIIDVELLDSQAGQKVEFKHVLFLNNGSEAKRMRLLLQVQLLHQAASCIHRRHIPL